MLNLVGMRRSPPKSTIDDIPRAALLQPNAAYKSSTPAAVVECWCLMVGVMHGRTLDKFTRETMERVRREGSRALEWATLRRRGRGPTNLAPGRTGP